MERNRNVMAKSGFLISKWFSGKECVKIEFIV
jgi:hypothetical protein